MLNKVLFYQKILYNRIKKNKRGLIMKKKNKCFYFVDIA
ncbi:hypothetical protein HMPREF9966_0705 [Streptococcus anginosus SK52 = DSM 20563]|nr:hypothetical protein HMPREF9966_0705 [Streptococcus anginosus SK52 = DSM 20563]